ncbi:N-alpha-acetyltransferase, non-catalitic subunit [Penicillium ochrochloron]
MLPNNEVRVPPRRALVQEKAVPRDITAEFTEAASKLRTGQLVKDETFTLFEAVGALEIMDSKMDSGYIAPGENHAQALEDDYDVRRDLTPEQVVGLMDQLLCHEMAWHMGHPLSQTLFTSIYIDKLLWPVPRTIEDARFDRVPSEYPLVGLVLRTYCLALVKACDFVHARVASEYFYEEEDFVTQLYNRNLLSTFDSSHFYRLLDQAVDWVDVQEGIEQKLRDAIRSRLLLRREFLAAVDQDLEILDTRSTDSFVSCLTYLKTLTETAALGNAVPEAFSLKLQRKLASTVPPRPIVHIKQEDALAHMKRLCQDAIDMQQMLDYRGPSNFKTAVWTLLSRKPQPSVYIRSLLQALIVSDMTILGAVSVRQFLYDDLAELVLPSSILLRANTDEVELPSDPRFRVAQIMEGFVKRFAQPYVDTVRSACLNRCRVRRTICHTVVDWDNLQMEAEELDLQLQSLSAEPALQFQGGEATFSYPLSSWAYHQKLIQLRLILQMGFELSVYAPEELPGIYWYLSHICSTHLSHLDRIRTFTVAARKRDLVSSTHGETSAHKSPAYHRSFLYLERLTTHIIAIDAFAIALHALYVLLARHQVLPSAAGPDAYSSDKLCYELRMKPFIPISLPELVPFEEYQREATLEGDTDATILDRASKAITEARKAWEATLANGAFVEDISSPMKEPSIAIEEDWRRDIKDTMRACIGASIAIETVKKALLGDSPRSESDPLKLQVFIPEIGSKTQWHDWWIVPQISEKKAAKAATS